MVFTEGTPLDYSLPCSHTHATEPFVAVFTKSSPRDSLYRVHSDIPLDHSLTCSERARHCTIHYRVYKWHATGYFVAVLTKKTSLVHSLPFYKGMPLGHSLSCSQMTRYWTIHCFFPKGTRLDHLPSQFSTIITFIPRFLNMGCIFFCLCLLTPHTHGLVNLGVHTEIYISDLRLWYV